MQEWHVRKVGERIPDLGRAASPDLCGSAGLFEARASPSPGVLTLCDRRETPEVLIIHPMRWEKNAFVRTGFAKT